MTKPKIKRLRTERERNRKSKMWLRLKQYFELMDKYPECFIKISYIKQEDVWKSEAEYGIHESNKQIYWSFSLDKNTTIEDN